MTLICAAIAKVFSLYLSARTRSHLSAAINHVHILRYIHRLTIAAESLKTPLRDFIFLLCVTHPESQLAVAAAAAAVLKWSVGNRWNRCANRWYSKAVCLSVRRPVRSRDAGFIRRHARFWAEGAVKYLTTFSGDEVRRRIRDSASASADVGRSKICRA